MPTRTHGVLVLLLGLGCGPQVFLEDSAAGQEGSTSHTGQTEGPVPIPGTTEGDETSTSGTTSTTGLGSSSSSDDVDFITEPDFGGCLLALHGPTSSCFECDVFAQDCPEGEKCVPWANDGTEVWNASRCSPIADDPAQPGEPCTAEGSGASGLDDCDIGAYCWNVDPETLMGECVAQCTGDAANPVCEEGTHCVIANDGYITFCLPICDPVASPCPEGQVCFAYEEVFVCAPTAEPEAAIGDPCNPPLGCGSSVCVEAPAFPGCGGLGCCSPYCDTTTPEGLALCQAIDPAMSCVSIYMGGEPPPGYEHVGVCRAP